MVPNYKDRHALYYITTATKNLLFGIMLRDKHF